jgi:hypothetical protein
MPAVHLVLVHHPTIDKQGDVAATSVTNLDIHDLSRVGCTYGVAGMWIVHPVEGMLRYVEKVLDHWTAGWGAAYNPRRRESLLATHVARDLGEVADQLEALHPGRPLVWVATSARQRPNTVSFAAMRRWLHDPADPRVFCILFGTGWGLHPCVLEEMDFILEPIQGPTPWNHLSVRAAAGIVMDRLLGRGRDDLQVP